MRMNISSVMVDDQEKALKFYTQVLGFVKKEDITLGAFKWLTVVSPEGPDSVEMLLEPNQFPPAKVFQKALYDAGIPARMFGVDDTHKEYERLTALGVAFTKRPTKAGPVTIAVFDDTCGNLIQIAHKG